MGGCYTLMEKSVKTVIFYYKPYNAIRKNGFLGRERNAESRLFFRSGIFCHVLAIGPILSGN